ncbi:Atrial natriuretic peptide receptor [Echinococcus granulosus]|uniref:guanylate cyclase n=1 Tax=Echinococcus granulosus TaxID=6210 RepID=W6UL05_ECHGR|nr:Atrial natriuretic peptide receptor [Echinococcus granulosus]EUB54184.1 Atrial natriuretic peptide receptor [Echinococcus granulosus]
MGCCVTPDSFSLVYEYCHRGCLQDLISNKSFTFDWDFKLSLMTDFVRITDFGIPKIYNLTGSCPSIKTEEKLWTSPELLRDETAALFGTKSGDVYAFAIIMHEVFYQTKPYGLEDIAVEEILKRVRSREKPPFRPQVGQTELIRAFT